MGDEEEMDTMSQPASLYDTGPNLTTPNNPLNMLKWTPTTDLKPQKLEERANPVKVAAWMNNFHAYFLSGSCLLYTSPSPRDRG